MNLRALRDSARLSQEQLSEAAGLSLRTIQRAEAGHRVSYASLRAMAKVLEMDADELELELYAVNKTNTEFSERPLWVRLLLNRAFITTTRAEMMLAEVALAAMGGFLGLFYLLRDASVLNFGPSSQQAFTSMLLVLVSAYLVSIFTRVSDKYGGWSADETETK